MYAEDAWIRIQEKVDPALVKVIFINSNKIKPAVFGNGHHAINKCYKVRNGYLTFIESGEGIFEGYEFNKYKPRELAGQTLTSIDEKIVNQAGIFLGMSKQDVERIIKRRITSPETRIAYESVELINDIPFDVITSLIIDIEENELSRFTVITSRTN